MKHLKLLTIFFIISLGSLSAQVTIGSGEAPEKAALLEIKSEQVTNPTSVNDVSNISSKKGGLGLPRVMLADKTTLEPFIPTNNTDWINSSTSKIKERHAGLVVYNIKVSPDTETNANKIFKQGIYVWDGAKWVAETKDDAGYFFIPSFNIPLTVVSTGKTFDFYAEYAKQFTKIGNTTFVSSNSALKTVPSPSDGKLYARSELDYAITYYDANILENISISTNGVMTYDVKSIDTTPDSFINVVFIIK